MSVVLLKDKKRMTIANACEKILNGSLSKSKKYEKIKVLNYTTDQ